MSCWPAREGIRLESAPRRAPGARSERLPPAEYCVWCVGETRPGSARSSRRGSRLERASTRGSRQCIRVSVKAPAVPRAGPGCDCTLDSPQGPHTHTGQDLDRITNVNRSVATCGTHLCAHPRSRLRRICSGLHPIPALIRPPSVNDSARATPGPYCLPAAASAPNSPPTTCGRAQCRAPCRSGWCR